MGTFLNPLNSSMLAVALVTLQYEFVLSLQSVTWIITIFYISSTAAQPVMGKLGDRFGPRKLFVAGMMILSGGSIIAALSPTWTILCASRAVIACGSAAAFPSAVSIIRHYCKTTGQAPTRMLSRIQLASNIGQAAGPVLGGSLILLVGWRSIFWVCIPLALASAIGVAFVVPCTPAKPSRGSLLKLVRELDLPGIALFTSAITIGVMVLLRAYPMHNLKLSLLTGLLIVLFIRRETTVDVPFLDIRTFIRNRALMQVYATYLLLCMFIYSVLYGFPQFLEEALGMNSQDVGLIMLPLAIASGVSNPFVARAIERWGVRIVLQVGVASNIFVAVLALLLNERSLTLPLLIFASIFGLCSGIATVALNQAMFLSAIDSEIGIAAGLFQTSRHLGAILASCLLGSIMAPHASTQGWSELMVLCAFACAVAFVIAHSWNLPRTQ